MSAKGGVARISRWRAMSAGMGMVMALALVLLSIQCGKRRPGSEGAGARPGWNQSSDRSMRHVYAPVPAADVASSESGPTDVTLATAEAAATRTEIIYSGEMTLEVDDVEKAAAASARMARAAGGWVSETALTTQIGGQHETRLILRIPADRFSTVHDSLRTLGDLLLDSIKSEDVGTQFVDLEARLANLQREEGVVSGLFKREGKIDAVLQVERELSRIRGEIERIQGQLRYLKDRVAYSTLMIQLTPKRPALERKMAGWNLGYHVLSAWRGLASVARILTYVIIYGVIIVGPFGLIAWGVVRGARAARRPRA